MATPSQDFIEGLKNERFGPFDIEDLLGFGGMGVVFRGLHRDQGVPVAIKLITRAGSQDPLFRGGFRNEVQAVASLNHAAITVVFDYGETESLLPYYVMELADLGELGDCVGKLKYAQVRALMLTLLDALAHSHASDVIHRDIKPANILLSERNGRVIPKLTDFGLAYATEDPGRKAEFVGTPLYASPEQASDPWRKHGPWTDLYALGCVAFELLTGRPPFLAGNLLEVIRMHREAPRPPLGQLDFDVPDGVENWLHKLMAPAIADRFQNAADAARALERLPALQDRDWDGALPHDFATISSPLEPVALDVDAAGVPKHWVAPKVDRAPMRLVGAGLGLYELRQIPLVGRSAELEGMWAELGRAACERTPRAVVVRGPQGCGKSRMVEWFCQRAKELATATVLRAGHSQEPGPTDGVPYMLARHFRVIGLTRMVTKMSVKKSLIAAGADDSYEWEGLTEVISPAGSRNSLLGGSAIQMTSPAQRHALLRRFFCRLGEERPIIVVCDDVQWGADAIELAAFMTAASSQGSAPVLFVLIATDDLLAERSDEAVLLDNLEAADNVTTIELGMLDEADSARLVEELLMLKGDLSLTVAERTGGNPLFAVELVGDWVRRGLLEVSERGFVVTPGASLDIPDSLHNAWAARLDELIAEYGEELRPALELAGALGDEFAETEWRQLCEDAGVRLRHDLPGTLVERRFARRTESGWSWAHAIIRECIRRSARAEQRWQTRKAACADLVARLYDSSQPEVAERLGRYLLGAEQFDDAARHLLSGARARRSGGEYRAALRLLSDCEAAMEHAHGAASAQRPRVWLTRAVSYMNMSRPAQAKEWCDRIVAADEQGAVTPLALAWMGVAKQWLGEPDALDVALHAHASLDVDNLSPDVVDAFGAVANILGSHGEFERAEIALDRQRMLADRIGKPIAGPNAYARCRIAILRGDWNQARQEGARGLAGFEEMGHFPGTAACREYLAEVYRRTGEVEEAAALLRECIELQHRIGFSTVFARLGLAGILIEQGETAEAEEQFAAAAKVSLQTGRKRPHAVAQAGLALCAARRGTPGVLAKRIGPLEDYLQQSEEPERDIAAHLEAAGDELAQQDNFPDAARVYRLALGQWERVGEKTRVREVIEKLHGVEGLGLEETTGY